MSLFTMRVNVCDVFTGREKIGLLVSSWEIRDQVGN